MTASDAQVWRRMWNDARGVILARSQAYFISRECSDLFHRVSSVCRNMISLPLRPAHCCRKKSAPAGIKITWRGLPVFDLRMLTILASGLKSCTSSRASSLYQRMHQKVATGDRHYPVHVAFLSRVAAASLCKSLVMLGAMLHAFAR
jgi:hypothetical protein